MNAYQRVMNTLTGAPVDRLPVFAVLGAYGGKLTNTDLRTLYSDAGAYVAGQKALQAEFGFDLVLCPFDFSAISEAFGGEVAWCADQVPNMKRPAVQEVAAALRLPLPDPEVTGRLPFILEATRRLSQIYREQVPLIGVLPGPGILPALFVGMDRWMDTVLFDAAGARELMDHTGSFLVSWANALLAAGADCLVFTEGMAAAEIVPRGIFEGQFLPHLAQVFARIAGPKVVSSTGGSMNHVLDLFPGLEGLVGVSAGSRDDLAVARRLLGTELTLIGNLDNLTLPTASAAEVTQLSLARLRSSGASGHFILGNSGADLPQATPPENLRAMLEAAKSYSKEIGCGI